MALERQKYRAMDHAAQLAKVTFFYINFNDMCVCVHFNQTGRPIKTSLD